VRSEQFLIYCVVMFTFFVFMRFRFSICVILRELESVFVCFV